MAWGKGSVRHLWLSPWTRWVGYRYLKSKKTSRFLSFVTILSMLGVGLGVTSIIVVLSVMEGFEGELKKRLMSSDLHILVTPRPEVESFYNGTVDEKTFDQGRDWLKSQKEVQAVWPVLSTEVILKMGQKVTGVVVKGVGQDRLERLLPQVVESAEPQMLLEGEGADAHRLPGIFVGQEMAYLLGLIPGDRVTLVSPTEMEGPMRSIPRMKRYVLEGVYRSGLQEQELHTVFVRQKSLEAFLRKRNVISQWEISVQDFDQAGQVASSLRSRVSGFSVRDWRELNANLFASLRLERLAMFVILVFIVIVASFNIVTTLTLMVTEKRKEISILKAIGARDGQVGAVFLSEGIFIGGFGILGGTTLSLLVYVFLKRYPIISLPEVYYDRTLPVSFDPFVYGVVALSAFLIVLAACLYPSRKATQLNPLDGIRLG